MKILEGNPGDTSKGILGNDPGRQPEENPGGILETTPGNPAEPSERIREVITGETLEKVHSKISEQISEAFSGGMSQ